MATFRPATVPRRTKRSNIFSEARYQIQLSYYRYEIITCQYIMSPGEKFAYNTIILSLLLLFFSAVYYYLPKSTVLGLRRLAYYVTGRHELPIDTAGVTQEVFQVSGDAVASLVADGGPRNVTGSTFAS